MRGNLWRMVGLCLLAGVLVAGLLFPVVGGLGLLSNQVSTAISRQSGPLETTPPPAVTRVLDARGNVIAHLYDQYRIPVNAGQVSNTIKAAIVAVEDKRFYQHGGLDLQGTLRAAFHDLGGGTTQGASSLTQQYVKNYLVNVAHRNDPLEQQRDQAQTIARKLREAKLALNVDQRMSKREILTKYLNVVSFGPRVYGVAAAAHAFFHTTADKLTVPQAALLAGLVNDPVRLSPWDHPKQALQRRNLVIDRMVTARVLDRDAARTAKQAPLGILPEPDIPSSSCVGAPPDAGFFCDYVKRYLENTGMTKQQIESGGYTIRTTMDPRVARAAKRAVDRNVSTRAEGVANAFPVIRTGKDSHDVLAMVANRNFGTDAQAGETSVNIVSEPRNTFGGGSSFKVFTSAAALEQGTAGLDTSLPNPTSDCFLPPNANRYTQPYCPSNISGNYPNPISLREALATSPNVAFVGLEKQVGLGHVIDMAYRLGLRHTLDSNQHGLDPTEHRGQDPTWSQPQAQSYRNFLGFTLGFSPVSPLEMANVAATIRSDGVWCPPDPIASVTDRNGDPVPVPSPPCQQAVSPGVASALAQGLSQDTVSGTSAGAAQAAGWQRPDIGKTGTTQDNKSVTFVGAVNDFAVASMVFADDSEPESICPGRPVTHSSDGCGDAFGGTVAAPPYFDAFERILAGKPSPPVPPAREAFLHAQPHGPVVPAVMRQQAGHAADVLHKAGYQVRTKPLRNALPAGTVIGQTPMGNIERGATITLYVSSGPR